MKIDIHMLNFEADDEFLNRIYNRIKSLNNYSELFTNAEVFLKKEQNSEEFNLEIRLHGRATDISANTQLGSFDDALESTYEKILNELKKRNK
ncbi:HPF/RaiA family ribosome-associated protein [Cytophagaceae bacterium DM2B3-1]|uniref:HPF/RaiA family ribosome-associated protein n=2 Tax=Xanthocytophaga TaxID=3078918 RepID=A0AAE3QI60_9BACT|nr:MULTISPECIES: HPF/RaiA family ribosome-associated protein [Xanthocytophaga]MDJ1467706.1 HPF/RaiA family ribosome-associated protein [Xanthocytophaga flavus]MDJ1479797.1 HPF/RaiA family ribosome-associated protein [Xanthocytophaga flavus]MDJ1493786.1 HPF/RaiA family ribosome-associated protein [Xanthocytophaga flavus]MDJ1501332.1 HPF/RaiA family ribosome-associated protein [Xanthocytophaga agilis]